MRALTGAWDPARPTEGAYSALLTFENGAFATLTYSGYAHFDSDEFTGWIGEMGQKKDPAPYGAARQLLAQGDEPALKNSSATTAAPASGAGAQPAVTTSISASLIVSCEQGRPASACPTA